MCSFRNHVQSIEFTRGGLQSSCRNNSRMSLSSSKLLPFKNDGDLKCYRNVLGPFPRSVSRHNPVSDLYGQFFLPQGLVFALTCTVNCGTLYRPLCAFPNHVQSIEFTTGGLQSSWRNKQGLSMEAGCT